MIRAWALAALLLGALPGAAQAQIFLASRPHPDFEIGPLFVRARVSPSLDPVTVDVFFSLVVPPKRSGADIEQDLFLLWPSAVTGAPGAKAPDRSLAQYIEARGSKIVASGSLLVFIRPLYQANPPQDPVGRAPFVTFVRDGGPLGPTPPATYIRIPWFPAMVNRTTLMDLRLTVPKLVQAKRSTWVEEAFSGPRHLITLTFNDLRGRALFPLYLENRDRLIRLSEDPSQLLINFADVDHLKIAQVSPPTANRRTNERQSTETISAFLDRSEGLKPHVLTVEFGYFSGLRSWAPILIPILFFAAGNLAGPLIKTIASRIRRTLTARLHIGRGGDSETAKQSGVVMSKETLAQIVPGTTREDVLRLCGPNGEEFEQLGAPDRRTLIYRGHKVVPQVRRTFGWLATVSHWDVEHHEVEIALDHERVRDVQARVRRSRSGHPDLTT